MPLHLSRMSSRHALLAVAILGGAMFLTPSGQAAPVSPSTIVVPPMDGSGILEVRRHWAPGWRHRRWKGPPHWRHPHWRRRHWRR